MELRDIETDGTTLDALASLFSQPFMLPIIILFIGFIVGSFIFFMFDVGFEGYLNPRTWLPARQVAVQIAYKKANIRANSTHFAGVTHTHYQADAEAYSGPGFHAYDTFEQALAHPQEGNVVLEVLLSGKITKMELGYIASNQRVLQVMPHRCSFDYCDGRPSSFEPQLNGQIFFYCPSHARPIAGLGVLTKVANFFGGRNETIRVLPLSKLPETLPWLDDHKIVVASTQGKNKFIPTVLPDSVNSKE